MSNILITRYDFVLWMLLIQYSGKVCERFTPIEDGMRKLGYYNTLYTKVTG